MKTTATENKIGYTFTAIPTNTFFLLDKNCKELLFVLIQKDNYWKNYWTLKGVEYDGMFSKSLAELCEDIELNEKDTRLTIESLYRAGLINIICQGLSHKSNKFSINWNKIIEIESNDLIEILENQKHSIKKLPRGTELTYTKGVQIDYPSKINSKINSKKISLDEQISGQIVGQIVHPTIDNINNINNKENIINNKENIINNKENIINNNIINKKEFSNFEKSQFFKFTINDKSNKDSKKLYFELSNNYNTDQITLFFDFINRYKQNNDINKDVLDCILKVKQNFINI